MTTSIIVYLMRALIKVRFVGSRSQKKGTRVCALLCIVPKVLPLRGGIPHCLNA